MNVVRMLIGSLALSLALGAVPARAQTACVEEIACGVGCTQAGQECGVLFEVSRETCGDFKAEYIASPGHCSSLSMRFYVDGVLVAESAVLGPGESSGEYDFGPLDPGSHTLGMEGVGVVGGCNDGYLEGWGGSVLLTYCAVAPRFIESPTDTTVCESGTASFGVSAEGGAPFGLYWQYEDPAAPGVLWLNMDEGPNLAPSGAVMFTATGTGDYTLTLTMGPRFSEVFPSGSFLVQCFASNACETSTTPPFTITVAGVCCPADFNGDGFLDFFDADAFTACFEGTECPPGKDADYNRDGFVDFFDADAFTADFEAGC